MSADLSIIDTSKYPTVQLKIQMETNSETPIIHSIKLGGGIIESFSTSIRQAGQVFPPKVMELFRVQVSIFSRMENV